MTVGGEILVVGGGSNVIGKADAVVVVLEVLVDETLIGSIEGYPPLCQGRHGLKVTQIRGQRHDARVEQVRPSYIRSSGEGVREVEELIGSSVGNNVGVYVDDFPELGQLP